MSGGNGEIKPEEQKEEKPKDVLLTITFSRESGELSVKGPGNGAMFDEPMCFWMLHKAQRFIEAVNARANQSQIIRPRPSIRDIFPKRGH